MACKGLVRDIVPGYVMIDLMQEGDVAFKLWVIRIYKDATGLVTCGDMNLPASLPSFSEYSSVKRYSPSYSDVGRFRMLYPSAYNRQPVGL